MDKATSDEDEGESQEAVAFAGRNGQVHLRPEVIVPTVTCDVAAALSVPAPGTVHLICVDPPYYNNVQYAELSNFFYVWLKRALHDFRPAGW
jgi:adenine-specific DNA methylase